MSDLTSNSNTRRRHNTGDDSRKRNRRGGKKKLAEYVLHCGKLPVGVKESAQRRANTKRRLGMRSEKETAMQLISYLWIVATADAFNVSPVGL